MAVVRLWSVLPQLAFPALRESAMAMDPWSGDSIAFQLLVEPDCILEAACSTDWEDCRRLMPGKFLTSPPFTPTPLMRPLCG